MKKPVKEAFLPFEVVEISKDIGAYIRAMRIVRRFTMADLAAKSSVSLRTLSDIENGKPGVQMVHVLNALWAVDGLRPMRDAIRLELDESFVDSAKQSLPRRVRHA